PENKPRLVRGKCSGGRHMAIHLRPALSGLSALVLLSAALGSSAAQDQVTLRFADLHAGDHPSGPVYKASLDAWRAAHPEVNLVVEYSIGDDQRVKLATDLAANNVADVFFNWTIPGDV